MRSPPRSAAASSRPPLSSPEAGGATVAGLVRRAETALAAAGVPAPRVDAELIVGHATRLSRAQLAMAGTRPVDDAQRDNVDAMVARRAAREPLQYVLGEWGFRRLTLTVDRRALVPRPETEIVVERCLVLLAGRHRPRVLDVGIGSGAIALAVADEHPGADVTGVDASEEALALARENVERTGLPVELRRHDLFTGLPPGPWDLVVSNPPYVDPEDLPSCRPRFATGSPTPLWSARARPRPWRAPPSTYSSRTACSCSRSPRGLLQESPPCSKGSATAMSARPRT